MKTVLEMQHTLDQGIDVLVGESPSSLMGSEGSGNNQTLVSGEAQRPFSAKGGWGDLKVISTGGSATEAAAEAIHKEIHKMRDKDLSDDQLKLVRYKVLFVKRDYEVAFPEREELVHDNITGEAFTAWKIAEFIQRLNKEPIPDKWKKKNYLEGHKGGFIERLDEDDKKFLRVYYEVLERYVREDDDTEVDVLKGIRKAIDRLPRLGDSTTGGSGGSTADTSGTAGGGRGGD